MSNKKKSWDAIAGEYEKNFGEDGDYSHKYVIFPAINNFISATKSNKVVDLGCGTGVLCRKLFNNGATVTGIDFSVEMISIAKSKSKNIEYIVADITKQTQLKSNTYDFAFSVMVLHTISNYKASLKETNRILKKSNAIILIFSIHYYFLNLNSVTL